MKQIKPTPGSIGAIHLGCTCPPERRQPAPANTNPHLDWMCVCASCPVHGWLEMPKRAERVVTW